MSTIGFIGVGKLGEPCATEIIKKGHKVKYDSPINKLVRKNGKTMPKRKSSSKAKV